MERVTENVYAITDIKGCNPGYVVTSEGIVVIDTPQMPTHAIKMREEILKKGRLLYIINTENHVDHIFGNHYFAGLCPVISHQDTAKGFWSTTFGEHPYDRTVPGVQKSDPEGVKLLPGKENFIVHAPTITFQTRMTLRLGSHVLELYHTPGHTRGETTVYVPRERVAFTGDNIFSKCQMFFQEANPDNWLESLNFLKTLDADHLIPGHGPVCDKKYIPVQSAFIREWVTALAVGMAKGWSKEECMDRISFLDRLPMDVGHESFGPALQRVNAGRLFDFLEGKIERY